MGIRLSFYRFLSLINRWVLPRFSRRDDLTRLSKWEQAIVGWKMWVTFRYLDAKNQH
ncbi:MAG: SsrA-binding protein [Flavobacteriales bacterium]|nr:SsrA-binding protein [Bacteroidota bacterium]